MRTLLLAVFAAAAWLYHQGAWSPAPLLGGPMDGTAWDVRLKPDSWFARSRRETFVFENGRLVAAGAVSSGFPAVQYSAEAGGSRLVWAATARDAQGVAISWQGLVLGDRIEGTVLWSAPDGTVRRFSFKGSRKQA